jgi:glycerol kinase
LEVILAYVLALDQGTTSSRAILFDHDGAVKSVAQREFEQIFPQAGWVEHDPEEIWASQISVAVEALSRAELRPRDIVAMGIANQRETTIVWDRETGKAVYNGIVWQDRRTAVFCDELKAAGHEALIQQRTGLLVDPYFSGSKLRWILDHVANARRLADAGRLAFGTVDSWLVWKLTSGRLHVTDVSNASRTMLFNIHTCKWDEEILRLLHIPSSLLPTVRASSEVYGEVTTTLGLGSIAIAGIAGDQQAALFGQRCISPGLAKNTYGTGCFLLQNTGHLPVPSSHRLITTVAWKIADVVDYALEGSVFIGGAVVQWLRDGLHLIRSSNEIEALAKSVPDNGGVYIVPAFVGLGAPHWDQYARGSIFGLTHATTAGHLARAALESIAFQVADLFDAMQRDTEIALPALRVDGGAAANEILLQFQADILGIPVVRPAIMETTALGVAYMAGLAVAFWRDAGTIAAMPIEEKRFEPRMPRSRSESLRGRWNQAVSSAKGWDANPQR